MKNKGLVKIFVGGGAAGLVLVLLWGVLREGEGGVFPPAPTPLPTITGVLRASPRPTLAPEQIVGNPAADTLNIDGIEVNNFYRQSPKTNPEGDTLVVDSEDYQIVYFPENESFIISVLGSPFERFREEAEREFLRVLGIGESEACRLTVGISAPRFANPEQAGKRYRLSFCE